MSDLWRVRLRTKLPAWTPTSIEMPREAADELAADIDKKVIACGDGWRFFVLEQTGGIRTRVRGRDVVGIEVIRAGHDRRPASAGAWRDEVPATQPVTALPALPPALVDATPAPAAAGPATQFLQSLPDRHPQVRPARRGGTR